MALERDLARPCCMESRANSTIAKPEAASVAPRAAAERPTARAGAQPRAAALPLAAAAASGEEAEVLSQVAAVLPAKLSLRATDVAPAEAPLLAAAGLAVEAERQRLRATPAGEAPGRGAAAEATVGRHRGRTSEATVITPMTEGRKR